MIKGHDNRVGFTHELSNANFEVFLDTMFFVSAASSLRKDMNPLSIVEPINQKIEPRLFKSSTSNDRDTTTAAVDDPFEVVAEEVLVIGCDPAHIIDVGCSQIRDKKGIVKQRYVVAE